MPAFYATYLFGEVHPSNQESRVIYRFGHRRQAELALWVLRIAGAILVVGSIAAAIQQPIFVVAALFVGAGIGALLWLYRVREDDTTRLDELVTSLSRSTGRQ